MKNAAVFVDTRPGFSDIINQHMKHLIGFDLFIFTANDSVDSYVNISGLCRIEWMKRDIKTANDYNRFLTSAEFWEHFREYNRVLIFQHDSMILKNNIEDFMEWDYIGAPWTFQDHGGNGGLSLRNPRVMESICRNYDWDPSLGNEDIFFCNIMHEIGFGKLAPRYACRQFSMETIYEPDTFGVHAIEKYHTPEVVYHIKSKEVK